MRIVVTEQLSRRRITSRSSPIAAPITALMAMKWLNTTVSVPICNNREATPSRYAM